MGLLIGFGIVVLGGLAIGSTGGVMAARHQQVVVAALGTIVAYYVLVGIPWALLLMEREASWGSWIRGFGEAYFALAKTLLLLGLLPLLITFAIAYWVSR